MKKIHFLLFLLVVAISTSCGKFHRIEGNHDLALKKGMYPERSEGCAAALTFRHRTMRVSVGMTGRFVGECGKLTYYKYYGGMSKHVRGERGKAAALRQGFITTTTFILSGGPAQGDCFFVVGCGV